MQNPFIPKKNWWKIALIAVFLLWFVSGTHIIAPLLMATVGNPIAWGLAGLIILKRSRNRAASAAKPAVSSLPAPWPAPDPATKA